jgi:HD superfamily phosphohydrolase YqeK
MVYTINHKLEKEFYKDLPESIINHMLSTAEMTKEIADIYKVDGCYSYFSAKYHDIFRDISDEEARELVTLWEIDVDEDEYNAGAGLLHGPIAGSFLKKWGLPDEITIPIRYHTTGKVDLSISGKILIISDVLEYSREDVKIDDLRKLIGVLSFDEVYMLVIDYKVNRVISLGLEPHKRSMNILGGW